MVIILQRTSSDQLVIIPQLTARRSLRPWFSTVHRPGTSQSVDIKKALGVDWSLVKTVILLGEYPQTLNESSDIDLQQQNHLFSAP
jgi:hypothetical protein